MHYLLTVIGDTDNPADDSAPGAIDAFNDRLKDEGRWVFAGGLTDPQDATVTDSRGGEPVFTDGPFVESKEFLAGERTPDVALQEAQAAYGIQRSARYPTLGLSAEAAFAAAA